MLPIQEGDIVDVYYGEGLNLRVLVKIKVLHVPQDTGDLWYFEDEKGNIIVQNPMASSFNYMRKKAVVKGGRGKETI